MKSLSFLLLIIAFSFNGFSTEKGIEADFNKVEADYTKGDYKAALKKAKLLQNKIERTYGEQSLMRARLLAVAARINDGIGFYDDYQKSINLSINTIQLAPKSDTLLWVKVLGEVANAYIQYGDYGHSEETLKQAFELVKTGKIKDAVLIYNLKDKLAVTYFGQGYLLRADALMAELIQFRAGRIVKKEEYKDEKGVTKTVKVSSTERENRIRTKASLTNFYAEIALENGDLKKCDSILDANSSYIKKSLRKKDVTYVKNLYLNGLYYERLNKNRDANEYFAKAGKLSGKTKKVKYKHSHKDMITIHEKLVISHKLISSDHKSKKRKKILETRVNRYYGKNSPYTGRMILMEAECDLMEKNYKRSEEKAFRVINNPVYGAKNHSQRVKALSIVYKSSLVNDQFTKAEDALTQTLDVKKELNGTTSPAYQMAQMDLANFQTEYSDKFKEAEKVFEASLKSVGKEVDHRQLNYLDYVYGYAKLFEYTDRFDESLNVLENAVEDSKKYYGENHPKYAKALVKYSNVLIDLGRYSDSEKKLLIATEIFRKEGETTDRQDYSEALLTNARLSIVQGDFDDAKRLLKKSINKQTGSSEDVNQSAAIEELATLYIELGKYQETEKKLKESIRLKEQKYGKSHRTLVNPLNQLSHLYIITGNYLEAEHLAKRAKHISETLFSDHSLKSAESMKLLSSVYSAIGDYEKAEEMSLNALAIQKTQYGENHIQVAKTLSELALIKFFNKADINQVEGLLNQALKITGANVGENHPTYAGILYNLGLLQLERNDYTKSLELLNKANSIWVSKLGENNIHTAEVLFMKGNIAFKKQNYTDAKVNYVLSKNIYSRIFDTQHPGYLTSLSRSGQMDYILGNYKESVVSMDETTNSYLSYIKKYFPSLSENEKAKFWSKIQKDFEFYQTLAVKLKNENPSLIGKVYNNTLSTKAILLNSSIKVRKGIMQSKDTVLIQKFEEWISKKEFLTSAISMTAEQRKEGGVDIKLLEVQIEDLEKELSSRSNLFAENFKKSEEKDWEDVKKSLKDNEAAIEIIRFNWFDKDFSDSIVYAALVITSDSKSNPEMILLENGFDMETKWLKYYRNCMKFAIKDSKSYEHFWKPIEEKVRNKSTVYFSADGVYNQINLETLFSGAGKYVIDEKEIVLISNTKDLIAKHELEKVKKKDQVAVKSHSKVALFGNPDYYSGTELKLSQDDDDAQDRGGDDKKVNQLPGAEQEVKALNSLLNTSGWESEAFLNEDATEQKIKDLENIKVFHIATHGFFQEKTDSENHTDGLQGNKAIQNPLLRSGLLLKDGGYLIEKENLYEYNSADGILTAFEAMNLNFDNCELVVLSACETGLGKVEAGEGVFGLQRAFLVAGAKTVIMSLFKVDDVVTQELMQEFYSRWIKTGDKRKSFLEAKRMIKDKYNNPIYWGAFIMVGLN